tara:strand:+ start:690 stop:941 length:252 start_codon:yes stop_codon:yes gene_type:complete
LNWEDVREGHGQRLVVLGDWIKAGEVDKGEILAGFAGEIAHGTRDADATLASIRPPHALGVRHGIDGSDGRVEQAVASSRRGR